jgi:hypothetical protein
VKAFLAAFDALPLGVFTGVSDGRRYVATRQIFAGGAAQKLVAEELGSGDYISSNVYRLASSARLRPCEMAQERVVRFVLGLQVAN